MFRAYEVDLIITKHIDSGTNLFQLATHQFGQHVFGLEDSKVGTAVMHSIHDYRTDFKLETDDINEIQVYTYFRVVLNWWIYITLYAETISLIFIIC